MLEKYVKSAVLAMYKKIRLRRFLAGEKALAG
jgi:hypothetical protein